MSTKKVELLNTLKEELRRPRGIVVILFLAFIAGVWIAPRIQVASEKDEFTIVELPMPEESVTPTITLTPTPGSTLIERPDLYSVTPVSTGFTNSNYAYTTESAALTASVINGVFGLVGNIIGLQMGIVNHTIGNVRDEVELKNEFRETRNDAIKQWLEKFKKN